MVNSRIASYMPGGDTTQEILDMINSPVWSDPRMRELCTMQDMEMTALRNKHSMGKIQLALAIKKELEQNNE